MIFTFGYLLIVVVFLGYHAGGENLELVEFDWLFDDHFEENAEEDIKKNIASSTEHLASLYKYEQEMVTGLLKFYSTLKASFKVSKNKNIQKLVKMLEKLKKYSELDTPEIKGYIDHMGQPIRAYHLLKRCTKTWPRKFKSLMIIVKAVKKLLSETVGESNFPVNIIKEFPYVEEFEFSVGCIGGILNVQRYYNITCDQIYRGRLGTTSQGHTLAVDDALLIAGQFTVTRV